MSFTRRPSSPPRALTSSSHIFWASSADLPLAPSPPVSAMLEPVLMGSPVCAAEGAGTKKTAKMAKSTLDTAPENRWIITLSSMGDLMSDRDAPRLRDGQDKSLSGSFDKTAFPGAASSTSHLADDGQLMRSSGINRRADLIALSCERYWPMGK